VVTTLTKRIGSTDMTFESGKLAKQAGGSAVVTLGETMILAA
jgi:polyribonucleotide nucleotidyltransferase